MENNNDKHPRIPGNGSPDPLSPAENNTDLSREIENGNEADIDDSIHNAVQEPTAENEQQDADDAVHKNYKPAKDMLHENDEHDPDDMVHGK